VLAFTPVTSVNELIAATMLAVEVPDANESSRDSLAPAI